MSKQDIFDHYAKREAQHYANPIPSRECILDYLKKTGRLVKREELCRILSLETAEQQEALRRRLRAMERDGQVILTRRKGYGLPDKMNLIRGRIVGHKDGFGFVVPEDGSDDLFLSGRQMQRVFHGDKVLACVTSLDRRGRREASVIEVLEHNTRLIVGRYFIEHELAFVEPINTRIQQTILISPTEKTAAEPGQIVVAEVTAQPGFRKQAMGRIVEILGEHMGPGMETKVAIRSYNLPHVWPLGLSVEIAKLNSHITPADLEGRVDLRHLAMVTIDGADAKDFDDAVYCEPHKKTWRLWVAIADVSYYVQPDTALDSAAFERGTSVYFPNITLPMLPETLSNELCSLKPAIDRLCLVCEMTISAQGILKRYQFYPAVIHSKARLTYEEVTNMLANSSQVPEHYQSLSPHLKHLQALYQILYQQREQRGSIDFNTPETQVIFSDNRKIKQILMLKRTTAHRIIEECMLLANVAAARFLIKSKLPSLFRVHDGPSAAKLEDLQIFLAGLGLRLPIGKTPKPADYADLLKNTSHRSDAHLIQTVLLRSLSQANYSPDNKGHFGLAFVAYTHFTSPIRRYPDLLVHRAIRYALGHGKRKHFYYDYHKIAQIGEHCSMTERRADEATREVLDWLKCEFMQERVGEVFEGVISNVTAFGLFVELQLIYVEGLIHVTALRNDYYHFDPIKHHLQGERTGIIYRLGDMVSIKVTRIDLDARKIDFELYDDHKRIIRRSGVSKIQRKRRAKKPDH